MGSFENINGDEEEEENEEEEKKKNNGEVSVPICERMDAARYVVRRMASADLQQVRDLHTQLFPVRYSASFFDRLLENPEGNITSLVLVDTNPAEESKKKMGGGAKEPSSAGAQRVVGVATCRVATAEDSILGFIMGRQEACK